MGPAVFCTSDSERAVSTAMHVVGGVHVRVIGLDARQLVAGEAEEPGRSRTPSMSVSDQRRAPARRSAAAMAPQKTAPSAPFRKCPGGDEVVMEGVLLAGESIGMTNKVIQCRRHAPR